QRFSMSASMRSAPKRRTRFHPRKATATPAASDSNAIIRSPLLRVGERPRGPSSRCSRVLPGEAGVFARLGLVDFQRLPVDVAAIEAGDRGVRFVVGGEFHEAEALRLAAGTLGGDVRRDELPVRRGEIVELRIVDLLGEISYVHYHLELLAGVNRQFFRCRRLGQT